MLLPAWCCLMRAAISGLRVRRNRAAQTFQVGRRQRQNVGMLALELETRDIPFVYERFAHEIGEAAWKDRVAALKREIKGNPFLRRLHEPESAIAFQLEQLRELHERHQGCPVQAQ